MNDAVDEGGAERERLAAMRLRSERPRVVRLSRKVLAGGAAVGMIAIFGAVLWRCRTIGPGRPHQTNSTAPIITTWPMASPVCRATMPVCPDKHLHSDRHCLAISAVRS